MTFATALCLSALSALASEIALVDFTGDDPTTTFQWRAQNDPNGRPELLDRHR